MSVGNGRFKGTNVQGLSVGDYLAKVWGPSLGILSRGKPGDCPQWKCPAEMSWKRNIQIPMQDYKSPQG